MSFSFPRDLVLERSFFLAFKDSSLRFLRYLRNDDDDVAACLMNVEVCVFPADSPRTEWRRGKRSCSLGNFFSGFCGHFFALQTLQTRVELVQLCGKGFSPSPRFCCAKLWQSINLVGNNQLILSSFRCKRQLPACKYCASAMLSCW